MVLQFLYKQDPQTCVPIASTEPASSEVHVCSKSRQHRRCTISRCHQRVPGRFPISGHTGICTFTRSPIRQVNIVVAPLSVVSNHAPVIQPISTSNPPLHLTSSPLRPPCRAEEHLFLWRGVNNAPT